MQTSTVSSLTTGIAGLFKKNKVDWVKATGTITGPNQVTCALNAGGSEVLETDKILIATGSEPSPLGPVPVDEKRIVTSTGALELTEVPKNMVGARFDPPFRVYRRDQNGASRILLMMRVVAMIRW